MSEELYNKITAALTELTKLNMPLSSSEELLQWQFKYLRQKFCGCDHSDQLRQHTDHQGATHLKAIKAAIYNRKQDIKKDIKP